MPLAEDDIDAWVGEGAPDAVIETVGGAAKTLDQAIDACRPAGRIVILGVFLTPPTLNAIGLRSVARMERDPDHFDPQLDDYVWRQHCVPRCLRTASPARLIASTIAAITPRRAARISAVSMEEG